MADTRPDYERKWQSIGSLLATRIFFMKRTSAKMNLAQLRLTASFSRPTIEELFQAIASYGIYPVQFIGVRGNSEGQDRRISRILERFFPRRSSPPGCSQRGRDNTAQDPGKCSPTPGPE